MGLDVTNVKVEQMQVIWNGVNLGYTEGDIEPKIEEKLFAIKAHQTGDNVIGHIRTGKEPSFEIDLMETSVAQIKALLAVAGATPTALAEVSTIKCVADVAGSLNSRWFTLYSALNAKKVYVWFNINSAGVDPAPSGYDYGITVAGATGASAATLATALASALEGDAGDDFTASASGATVTCTNEATGGATDLSDGTAATAFTFAVTQQGISAVPGWGLSKDGTQTFSDAKKLELHPSIKAATDQSEDLCFWKAYPNIKSIKNSGDKPKVVKVTFHIYPAQDQPDEVKWFVYGAHQ